MTYEHHEHGLNDIAVTRVPIFDKKKEVFSYEFFFQSPQRFLEKLKELGVSDSGNGKTPDPDNVFSAGLRKLSFGKPAIITFNREMLLEELPFMFPVDLLVVNIDHNIGNSDKLLPTIEKIKKNGYLIAVSDSLFDQKGFSNFDLADIIRMNFNTQGNPNRFSFYGPDELKPRILVNGIESLEDFESASEKNYDYFQGNFFCKPYIRASLKIPAYKINLVRILKEINKTPIRIDELESLLKRDLSMTYQLLRFINSASFGIKTTVQSIRQAIMLLGETEISKWLSLVVLGNIGNDKPNELIIKSLIRAKLCESVAWIKEMKHDMPHYFLMGMFSLVDAFLDRPMAEILEDLPLKPEIKAALLGNTNEFRNVLNLVIDYEEANWENVSQRLDVMKLDLMEISNLYIEAVDWAKHF